MQSSDELRLHVQKVLAAIALVALGLLFWKLSGVLVLVFGAILVAALLRTLSSLVMRLAPLPEGVALAVVVVALAALLGTLSWLFGSRAADELATLAEILPGAYQDFQDWLDDTRAGQFLSRQIEALEGSMANIATSAGAMAMSLGGGVANLLLILMGGIYLAAQPGLYRTGLLKLVPPRAREAVGDAVDASGRALRLWLGGQLMAMLMVGVLTGLGLWLLGVPAAFALALVAFFLDFVPIVGPIIAAIPGILLGFTVSPQVGLLTLALYLVIQQLEGNVLQPLIQQRAVELPPAMLLFSLVAFGILYGLPGVLLAAPLTVVTFVLVKRLYVRELLDTETSIPGEEQG